MGGGKTKSVFSATQSNFGDAKAEMMSTANEWDHLLVSRFETMILKPQHIDKVWDSSHMKEDLIAIL